MAVEGAGVFVNPVILIPVARSIPSPVKVSSTTASGKSHSTLLVKLSPFCVYPGEIWLHEVKVVFVAGLMSSCGVQGNDNSWSLAVRLVAA